MNQGDYINIIIKSVLSSILLGAVLAIIVLALFLKDIRPTIVVAFSIPFSVLFAIIIMYFTGININVMSLAGLCLGIGMLVDNSIVVMENIYRFHLFTPTAEEFRELFEKAGFTDIQIHVKEGTDWICVEGKK